MFMVIAKYREVYQTKTRGEQDYETRISIKTCHVSLKQRRWKNMSLLESKMVETMYKYD